MVKIYVFKLPKKLGKIVRKILGLFSREHEE
ncbi:stage V sporulation protein SpoVM [Thermosediminibacter oceani]|uniref:Stage V sporulation family protein n=1 Tax=Thermosediminibacter oceani (strain ATCC BAA-1034 / DSM 16646 / JW/IW-1228P) TaxID=555079 RepID=D9S319_THEOJ|nr:stage V sporulation protein SpoVM [Thermosediminibacter oceani]ADL07796.1 Stage V sporulation family protein [Thermosediminibacter oceani DSM 16646]